MLLAAMVAGRSFLHSDEVCNTIKPSSSRMLLPCLLHGHAGCTVPPASIPSQGRSMLRNSSNNSGAKVTYIDDPVAAPVHAERRGLNASIRRAELRLSAVVPAVAASRPRRDRDEPRRGRAWSRRRIWGPALASCAEPTRVVEAERRGTSWASFLLHRRTNTGDGAGAAGGGAGDPTPNFPGRAHARRSDSASWWDPVPILWGPAAEQKATSMLRATHASGASRW